MTTNVNLGFVADAAGTVDAITATYSPAYTALVDKMLVWFRATGANTSTTPTFSPNGLTPHTIVKQGGQALVAGDIPRAGAVMEMVYDSANTRWELLNPGAAASITGSDTQIMFFDGANNPAGDAGMTYDKDINHFQLKDSSSNPMITTSDDGGVIIVIEDQNTATKISIGEDGVDRLQLRTNGGGNVLINSDVGDIKLVGGNISIDGNLSAVDKVVDTSAGDAASINSIAGRFRKDTSGASFTLTNSFITANSVIILTAANAAIDASATHWTVAAGVGSAVITFNAAPTSNFDMNFFVIN